MMNANQQQSKTVSNTRRFVNACSASCYRLLTKLDIAKSRILAEFQSRMGGQDRMLHLAMIEAEALAWQTEFPLLVFPTLAQEKAEAVVAWSNRQASLLHSPPRFALAA
jgi:hypothetical protein